VATTAESQLLKAPVLGLMILLQFEAAWQPQYIMPTTATRSGANCATFSAPTATLRVIMRS
jgi:hypothetical protein